MAEMEIFLWQTTRTFRSLLNNEAVKTGRSRDAGTFVQVGDEQETRNLSWNHGVCLFTPIAETDEYFLVQDLSPIVMTMLLPQPPPTKP